MTTGTTRPLTFTTGVMSGIVGADNAFARDFNNPGPEMIGNISALYDIGCTHHTQINTLNPLPTTLLTDPSYHQAY